MGTISNGNLDIKLSLCLLDSEYLEFCESLTKSPSKEDLGRSLDETEMDVEFLLSKKEHQPKSTPLLDALKLEKERKAAKKMKKRAKEASLSSRANPTAKVISSQKKQSSFPGKSNVTVYQNTGKSLDPSLEKKKNRRKKTISMEGWNEASDSGSIKGQESLEGAKLQGKSKFTLIKKRDQDTS